jgi:hypothetical protein
VSRCTLRAPYTPYCCWYCCYGDVLLVFLFVVAVVRSVGVRVIVAGGGGGVPVCCC